MNSFERINNVINYIETQLPDEIDFSQISKIAGCPIGGLQRIFSFMTNISITEYIRRRKLSLAAIDIQQTDLSIIDIAAKYGYESHASFTRAFKEQHNCAPSSVRKCKEKLVLYPKLNLNSLSFIDPTQTYRIEKGTIKMANVKHIEFKQIGPYKMVGKEIRTKAMTQDISRLWGSCFSDGTYDKLLQLKDYIPTDIEDDYIGYVRDIDNQNNTFTYVVGMFMMPDTPVPDGFCSYDIPACTIANSWVEGEEFDIFSNGPSLTADAIVEHGYQVDQENYFLCEVYTDLRYGIPKKKGEAYMLDYYISCVKG